MKHTFKKSLAAFLAVLMLVSCIGISVSAEERNEYSVIRQNCTVYGDTKTQRGFTWYTTGDCESIVQIVKESDYDENFSKAQTIVGETTVFQGQYCHKAVATGLKAGTKYIYRVGSERQNTWGNISRFITDDGNGKFSFIAIGDVQASSVQNFYKASLVMDKAVKNNPDASFIVNLGDFVNDCTNEEWTWYGDAFEEYNTNYTLVPVAGNHEGNPTNKLNPGWFANQFNLKPAKDSLSVNGVYYSFDYGNAHFTVLNSNDMYPMTQAQRNWCINDINSSDARWKILLLHRAAYSAGKNIDKPDTVAMRDTIIEIVDETGVDLVLSGHDHMYMRTYQVAGDKVCENVKYVTEKYNGVETTFAVNPDGAIYALPGTAGTKRYDVNDNAIDPIKECAEVSLSQKDRGGCFANIKVDGGKLIYEAYIVNDDTLKLEKIDEYAIKKTSKGSANEDAKELPTDFVGTVDSTIFNFFSEIFGLLVTYITVLLPQVIKGLF